MISYQPPVYRPRLSQAVVVPAVAPAAPVVSVPDAGVPFPEGIFWTAIAGAAAWAGGIGAGLAALTGLTGILVPSVSRSLPLRWYF